MKSQMAMVIPIRRLQMNRCKCAIAGRWSVIQSARDLLETVCSEPTVSKNRRLLSMCVMGLRCCQ